VRDHEAGEHPSQPRGLGNGNTPPTAATIKYTNITTDKPRKNLVRGFISSIITASVRVRSMMDDDVKREALHKELDKKLYCGICLSVPEQDVVEMICPGSHTFCFSCAYQYVTSLRSSQQACCPMCRQGKGGMIYSPFLSKMIQIMYPDTITEGESFLSKFRRISMETLRDSHPNHFDRDRYIITPSQLNIYKRFTEQGIIIPTRIRAPSRYLRSNYVAVSINLQNFTYLVTSHTLQLQARCVVRTAPPQFTCSFVVKLNRNESGVEHEVCFQARPIETYLTMDFRAFCAVFDNVPTHLITQIETEIINISQEYS